MVEPSTIVRIAAGKDNRVAADPINDNARMSRRRTQPAPKHRPAKRHLPASAVAKAAAGVIATVAATAVARAMERQQLHKRPPTARPSRVNAAMGAQTVAKIAGPIGLNADHATTVTGVTVGAGLKVAMAAATIAVRRAMIASTP